MMSEWSRSRERSRAQRQRRRCGAAPECGKEGSRGHVRRLADLEGVEALILQGGGTTICKLLVGFGLQARIQEMARAGMPLMGTCASCILLAKRAGIEVAKTETQLLAHGHGGRPQRLRATKGVFRSTGHDRQEPGRPVPCGLHPRPAHQAGLERKFEVLARHQDGVVMARNMVALSFHPELSNDAIREMLIGMP